MHEKVKKIIEQRKKMNLNDDKGIERCWNDLIKVFSESEVDTIEYLEKCEMNELYWISEIFEDISKNLQSSEFIRCLKRLNNKYPELNMTKDIELAEEYMVDIE